MNGKRRRLDKLDVNQRDFMRNIAAAPMECDICGCATGEVLWWPDRYWPDGMVTPGDTKVVFDCGRSYSQLWGCWQDGCRRAKDVIARLRATLADAQMLT
jgi:hypothetical protein